MRLCRIFRRLPFSVSNTIIIETDSMYGEAGKLYTSRKQLLVFLPSELLVQRCFAQINSNS